MSTVLQQRLAQLREQYQGLLYRHIRRGIEKESMRITPDGLLAKTEHPRSLGSAMTHPHITTDFSEALMEFITPVSDSIDASLNFLDEVHRHTYANLDGELLWTASMPCVLEGDDNIPVAQYGSSNVARMKTIYRIGLGHRYSRLMQTIAGIHYNFSISETLWRSLAEQDEYEGELQDYIDRQYLGLVRNFRRYSWLLVYLFGASPAVCKSFLRGREHHLIDFDHGSFHAPNGTSLRMGDLGYQSNAQESLYVCYNDLNNYTEALHRAIVTPHPDYEAIGVRDENGKYRQLSSNLLQIENEFYSSIRPKRTAYSGEAPVNALKRAGIEYIEVRCVDVNPYLPLGIDAEQIRFIDAFLMTCLLMESPDTDKEEYQRNNANMTRVVNDGRDPELQLDRGDKMVSMREWASELLDHIAASVELLDDDAGLFAHSLEVQRDKINDPELTPSARVLRDMAEQDIPFFRLAMNQALGHEQHFRERPLSSERSAEFDAMARDSDAKREQVEAADSIDFDEFLANYYHQWPGD